MNSNEERYIRKSFETWASKMGLGIKKDIDEETYIISYVHTLWQGWLAGVTFMLEIENTLGEEINNEKA